VVIVAAGRGMRAGGGCPSNTGCCGQTVLAHTVAAFRASAIGEIVIVRNADDGHLLDACGIGPLPPARP
jgi:2-C-methyl-D-erythritol 4-phosphate cytidylyltransferase